MPKNQNCRASRPVQSQKDPQNGLFQCKRNPTTLITNKTLWLMQKRALKESGPTHVGCKIQLKSCYSTPTYCHICSCYWPERVDRVNVWTCSFNAFKGQERIHHSTSPKTEVVSCQSMCSALRRSPCVQNDKTKRTCRAPVSKNGAFYGKVAYLTINWAVSLVFFKWFLFVVRTPKQQKLLSAVL